MSRVWRVLYAKVKAYLVSGTAAAGIAGAVLWIVHASTDNPPSWVDGLVPAAAAMLVGLYVAYQTPETKVGVSAVAAATTVGREPPY